MLLKLRFTSHNSCSALKTASNFTGIKNLMNSYELNQ